MLGNAIVTGASQGIGKAIACRLSRDGFRVAINDLPYQKDQLEEVHAYITEQGGTSTIVVGDVSIKSEVKEMVDVVVERFGARRCKLQVICVTPALEMYELFR